MQEFEEDFYAILGIEETATPEEIRKAYLQLAKKLHPDRYPNDPEQRAVAQSEFAKVTRAHEVISDVESRTEYDALRALSRTRGGHAAMAEPIASGPSSVSEPVGADESNFVQTKAQQAQTQVDEETINVKWANKHLLRADELYRKKKYQEAETAMKEAIRLVPADPKYRNKLAEIYFARGWKTLALTEVQAALRIDPKDGEARNLEAKIRHAVKQSQSTSKEKNILGQLKGLFSKKQKS